MAEDKPEKPVIPATILRREIALPEGIEDPDDFRFNGPFGLALDHLAVRSFGEFDGKDGLRQKIRYAFSSEEGMSDSGHFFMHMQRNGQYALEGYHQPLEGRESSFYADSYRRHRDEEKLLLWTSTKTPQSLLFTPHFPQAKEAYRVIREAILDSLKTMGISSALEVRVYDERDLRYVFHESVGLLPGNENVDERFVQRLFRQGVQMAIKRSKFTLLELKPYNPLEESDYLHFRKRDLVNVLNHLELLRCCIAPAEHVDKVARVHINSKTLEGRALPTFVSREFRIPQVWEPLKEKIITHFNEFIRTRVPDEFRSSFRLMLKQGNTRASYDLSRPTHPPI